jgi:outer membrane protein
MSCPLIRPKTGVIPFMPIARIRHVAASIVLIALALTAGVDAGSAQDLPGGPLSLEGAIQLAVRNNPTFRAAENDAALADWDVRSAYASLLPSASVSGGLSWQGSGEQQIGGLTLGDLGIVNTPSYYFSNYSLGFGYQLDGRTLLSPSQANRSREATGARIRTAESALILNVTRAYLEAVRQREELNLAIQQLDRAQANLRLARTQFEVGSVTLLDVRQAEVQVGRAEVTLLRAETTVETSRLRLLQQIGVDGRTEELQLTSRFPLDEPVFDFDVLWDMALEYNPSLESLRASREAAGVGVKIARSAYLPTLSFSAGWSGFTRQASSTDLQIAQAEASVAGAYQNCVFTNDLFSRLTPPYPPQDCGSPLLPDDAIRAINDANDVFPFDFTQSPARASMTISLPIFQGLGRQRQIEAARVQEEDLQLQIREQELALRADLQAGLAAVRAGYQAALLEARNREVAADQLRLAQERYEVGSASFLDLVEAETTLAEAERARLAAIYVYHDALASLEALVGAPLRQMETEPQ